MATKKQPKQIKVYMVIWHDTYSSRHGVDCICRNMRTATKYVESHKPIYSTCHYVIKEMKVL